MFGFFKTDPLKAIKKNKLYMAIVKYKTMSNEEKKKMKTSNSKDVRRRFKITEQFYKMVDPKQDIENPSVFAKMHGVLQQAIENAGYKGSVEGTNLIEKMKKLEAKDNKMKF